MSKKYQEKLNGILSEDWSLMPKLYLIYELEQFAGEIDDEVVDLIYQGYLDNKSYNSIYDYVLAIQNWCELNDVHFNEVKDYKKMLDDIYRNF